MIRPLTLISFVLAIVAVLYTYRSAYEVQTIGREVARTVRDTATIRDQSRALKAEFTLRENPERLKQFADKHLKLQPTQPNQFVLMTDLTTRLPAPNAGFVVSSPAQTTDEPETADDMATGYELPIPPLPVPPPAVVPQSAPTAVAATAPAVPPSVPTPATAIAVAAPKPTEPRPVVAAVPKPQPAAPSTPAPTPTQSANRPPLQLAAPTPVATPVSRPVAAPLVQPVVARSPASPVPIAQPQGGSMLGMASGGSSLPMPRPLPDPTPVWSTRN